MKFTLIFYKASAVYILFAIPFHVTIVQAPLQDKVLCILFPL